MKCAEKYDFIFILVLIWYLVDDTQNQIYEMINHVNSDFKDGIFCMEILHILGVRKIISHLYELLLDTSDQRTLNTFFPFVKKKRFSFLGITALSSVIILFAQNLYSGSLFVSQNGFR